MVEEKGKLKKKIRQTLNIHQLLRLVFFLRVDSLAAPIHLRSPHSCGLTEGQNLENRLQTRHFVTRHPSPASQHRGAAHKWDTAASKYTSGGTEQRHCSLFHCIRYAFTLHLLSFRKKQKSETRWHFVALKFEESHKISVCPDMERSWLYLNLLHFSSNQMLKKSYKKYVFVVFLGAEWW